jgi:hypothetical protein
MQYHAITVTVSMSNRFLLYKLFDGLKVTVKKAQGDSY